jgi:hypothetical protein
LRPEKVCVTPREPMASHAEETWFIPMNFDEFTDFISDPVGEIKKYNEWAKGEQQPPITCIEHRGFAEFAIRFKLLKQTDVIQGWSALVQGLTTKCVVNVTVFYTGQDLPAHIQFEKPQTMQIVQTDENGVGCFHYDPDRPLKGNSNGQQISNDLLAMIWNPQAFANHLNQRLRDMTGRSGVRVHVPGGPGKGMARLEEPEASAYLNEFDFVAPFERDDLQIIYNTASTAPAGPGCYSCSGQIVQRTARPGRVFVLNNIMATTYCP